MSDVKENYDDRDASLYTYGPRYYGDLGIGDEDLGDGPCPPVDYSDPAYDAWNIMMSLRVLGFDQRCWSTYVDRSNGPQIYGAPGDADSIYDTLLFKMVISPRLHRQYDRTLLDLYQGFIRGISNDRGNGSIMRVTDPIIRTISGFGTHYIGGLFYHYKIIPLTVRGYFWNTDGNESLSDEEEAPDENVTGDDAEMEEVD